MKKLLMLSASVFEIPLIQKAQENGFYVITTGNNKNSPGHKISDEYAPFDYSDYPGMVELGRRLKIDAISQGCSDNCALVASYMGEKLGLKGHDTFINAQIIHRKDKFKEFVKKEGIKSPNAEYFSYIEKAKGYDVISNLPLIVKPADQAGGKGVSVVYDEASYISAVEKAFDISNNKRIVVEQYIKGTLHSFMSFIIDKKVVSYATLNDYSYANKYMTNTGVSPADNHEKAVKALIPEINKVAQKLELVDGLLHMQYIDREGEYWIIEMMRRMPGNNCTTAASRAFGIDWRDWIIRAEAGMNCSGIPKQTISDKLYGYHAVMSNRNGIYNGLDINNEIKNQIIDITEYEEPGSVIDDYLYQKLALVQFYLKNSIQKDELIGRINDIIGYKVLND